MATQKRLFDLAVTHLRAGNDRALCAFARTFGRDNAAKRLDAIQIRGAFDSRCTSFTGYDYAEQRWFPAIESNLRDDPLTRVRYSS